MKHADGSFSLRIASADDLAAITNVFYACEVGDDRAGMSLPPILADFAHMVDTGELTVAESEGAIAGFAGVAARDETAFLTDLFVLPARQSAGIGSALLQAAFAPHASRLRFTVSSTDPRALALYVRQGMRPRWPNLLLRAPSSAIQLIAPADIDVVPANPDDGEIVAWDTAIGGRARPQDYAFWRREQRGVALWFRRDAATLGYGIVRLKAGTFAHPAAARIGPIGVHSPDDAKDCLRAAVGWAMTHAPFLAIDIPGPHPALASLITGGFHITYVETFVSTAEPPFDPQCYVGSGGSLF